MATILQSVETEYLNAQRLQSQFIFTKGKTTLILISHVFAAICVTDL